MPVMTQDTPAGSYGGGGFPGNTGWPGFALSLYGPVNRQANEFYGGPDAAGPLMHRSWDPGDGAVPGSFLNLCGHPQFESITELVTAEGVPFSADAVRTFERQFLIRTKNATLGPTAVCACPGVPWPYSSYIPGRGLEYDLLARVVRLSARRPIANEYTTWVVTASYSTVMPEGGPVPSGLVGLGSDVSGIQNNPWDEPPHLEWDPETETKTPLADLDGKPFKNSAGQLIYPAPSVEEGVAVLVVTKNERFLSLEACRAHIEKYSYVVNLIPFLGASRGQVLSLPPKATEVYRGPLRYWRFTYRLKFKKRTESLVTWLQHLFPTDTWQPKLLDAGQFEIRDGWFGLDPNGTLVPIYKGGAAVNYPVPLLDGKEAPTGTYKWRNFRYYEEVDFSGIIIPPSKL